MFNLLISADETAWESGQRMGMQRDRFGEYSGDELQGVTTKDPASLRALERVQTLLMYESGVSHPHAKIVRVGQLQDIRVELSRVSFRFTEAGCISRETVVSAKPRLQIANWELNRTHWAVKDGEIPQDVLSTMKVTPKKYDIVLSFAGEDRKYVERVADFLNENGVSVFYDKYEQATLWGKDLAEHFEGLYRKQAQYCIMFISKHYAEKVWTRHEARSALARALEERGEYLLPARFDSTEVPGLRPTVGYLDLKKLRPKGMSDIILQKLGRR